MGIGGSRDVLGSALALGSTLTYAAYLLLSGELVQRVGSLRLVALAMTSSSLAGLIQYAVLRPLPTLFEQSTVIWQLSLVNATLCTVLPVFLTMIAVSRVGAGNASQAGMIGPVSTLILGWSMLGEPITWIQIAGTVMILTGIFLLTTRKAIAASVAA
jgi:drug/metabolite transporter (DMT)-like permease